MQRPYFELERIDADGLRRVAATLRGHGFTEASVRDRLGLKDLSPLTLEAYPYYLDQTLRRRTPLDQAIILFLLQGVLTGEELRELFDQPARNLLRQVGVLAGDRQSKTVRARVSLYPVEDRLVFTDHRFSHHPWLRSRLPREPVMYLGGDSYALARAMLRRPLRGVLDVCCGSGVHAILAASNAERAVGVDLNPRAINFARLNALMNDAWNAVFMEGDLFGPVAGERFDLILANPPFVPSPAQQLAYRDGGPSGADVLRRIVGSLPDFLGPEGVAQIVTHVAERDGESYLERVRRWLGGANMHLHSLRIGESDPLEYAGSQVRPTFGEDYPRYAQRLAEWVANLRSQRFHRVVAVVFTFAWNEEAPLPPWTQEDEAKPPLKAEVQGELQRLFQARRRVRKLPTLQSLDHMRPVIPDDMLLIERRRPTPGGFETKDFRILFRESQLSPELDVKPLVRDLLERVDGRSSVAQVIARLAQDTGQELSVLDERCRRAFLVMHERGLVRLEDLSAPAPAPAAPVAVHSSSAGPRPADPFLYSSDDAMEPRLSREPAREPKPPMEYDPFKISSSGSLDPDAAPRRDDPAPPA